MAKQENSASFQKLLESNGACRDAIYWAAGKASIRSLWDDCPEPEWLLRALKILDYRDGPKLRSFAAACARRSTKLFPDEKFIKVVEIAEAVACDNGDEKEMDAAFQSCSLAIKEQVRNPCWSAIRFAAVSCARDSVRADPLEAARHASRNGIRASPCMVKEAKWHLHELRRILDPDFPLLTQRARLLLEGRVLLGSSGEAKREHSQAPNRTVRQHFEIAGQCVEAIRQAPFQDVRGCYFENLCDRCAANLDGLGIAGKTAITMGMSAIENDNTVASVVAILLTESENNQPESSKKAVALFFHESSAIRQSAWWGLRLASSRHFEPHLRALLAKPEWDFPSAAALDILAFHRLPVQSQLGSPPDEDGDEIAWLLAEAGGRIPEAWNATHLRRYVGHTSGRVREAALRASARSGVAELPAFCREAVARSGPVEAIEYLGVVGSPADVRLLQGLLAEPGLGKAGVVALGRLGLPEGVPILVEALGLPELAEVAAQAIWRITGEQVPRGALPKPPEGMTEDELDLWEPVAPVDVAKAREWWQANASRFDPAKCYQVGLCVSDNPLGPVFDQLPMAVRYDVYLRERALTPGTPDWELETWPWKQKMPGA